MDIYNHFTASVPCQRFLRSAEFILSSVVITLLKMGRLNVSDNIEFDILCPTCRLAYPGKGLKQVVILKLLWCFFLLLVKKEVKNKHSFSLCFSSLDIKPNTLLSMSVNSSMSLTSQSANRPWNVSDLIITCFYFPGLSQKQKRLLSFLFYFIFFTASFTLFKWKTTVCPSLE